MDDLESVTRCRKGRVRKCCRSAISSNECSLEDRKRMENLRTDCWSDTTSSAEGKKTIREREVLEFNKMQGIWEGLSRSDYIVHWKMCLGPAQKGQKRDKTATNRQSWKQLTIKAKMYFLLAIMMPKKGTNYVSIMSESAILEMPYNGIQITLFSVKLTSWPSKNVLWAPSRGVWYENCF